MAKRNVVVCCDGTGNEYGDTNSNVVKLYSALHIDPLQQVGYYHPGVGTMGAPNARNKVEKAWTKMQGLARGAGLIENVSDAYRYLMNTYTDGDDIYIFGFSRGAYTARALGGMLEMFGLLWPGNEGLIPYIARMFATATKQAKGESHTPQLSTELAKKLPGHSDLSNRARDLAAGFNATFSRDCPVKFIGLWDTVESAGWLWDPILLPYAGRNPLYKTARHALSIDEHRSFFAPSLWGAPFLPGEDGFRFPQDVQQIWFAGVHSDVGGSYPEADSGLSKITLNWMLNEAAIAGLKIDPKKANALFAKVPPDPGAKIHESLYGWWYLLELLFRKDDRDHDGHGSWRLPNFGKHRIIPPNSWIHQSVFDRMALAPNPDRPKYAPTNLPPNEQFVAVPELPVSKASWQPRGIGA